MRDDARELRARYTASWLQRSEQFIALLHRPAANALDRRTPLLYITGAGRPTLARGVLLDDPSGGSNRVVFDAAEAVSDHLSLTPELFVEEGDGTVTGASARLPSAYPLNMSVTGQTYPETHADLMTSSTVHQAIDAFLRAEL